MILKVFLYIIITIIVTIILALSQQKIGLSFEKISLPQLAPAIAVLIYFLIYRNLPTHISLNFNKLFLVKAWVAVCLPVGLFAITFLFGKQLGLNVKITQNLSELLPIMFLGMIIGAVGEEIGWRSFMQPMLEKKNSVLVAAMMVGVIWGLWHMGHYKNGLLYMTGFILFTISASIIMAWLFRNTEYNLILSAIFHLSVNIGFLIFFKNSLTDSKLIMINGIVWLIAATGIVIWTGKNLVRT